MKIESGRPDARARAVKYLAKCDPAISGSGGDPKTFEVARAVVYGFDLGAEAGYDLLAAHYNPRCLPPWSEKELRHKCIEADTCPYNKPRGYLLEEDRQRGETNGKSFTLRPVGDGFDENGHPPAPPPWPDIVDLSATPEADPFPLDVYPVQLQDAIREIAAALNAPPDFAAVPLLVLAGASIGMSREVEITKGHKQRALLYAGVVGDPGSAKSPALGKIRKPTDAIQKEYRTAWDEEMKTYTIVKEVYDEEMKAWSKSKDKEGPRPIEPARPILRRVVVSDTTAESLIPILQDNPRGIVSIRDEVSAWVSSMDQYKSGKGAEKALWLSIWSNEPVYVDRKMHHDEGYLACPAPFIAVVGCLTPENLTAIRGDERGQKAKDDGFIDRVLLSFPESLPARGETWQGVSGGTHDDLDKVIRKLLTLAMIGITKPGSDEIVSYRPGVINLTRCGKDAWQEFTEAHADEMNGEVFAPCLKGAWSKLRGYCGRLALILHYLRWACGDQAEADLDGNTMRDAARLVGYFTSHAKKVHHVMDRDPATEDAHQVLGWIERKGLTTFDQRAAHCGPVREKADEVGAALKILVSHGHIRPQPVVPQSRGRPSSPSFEVNPAITARG